MTIALILVVSWFGCGILGSYLGAKYLKDDDGKFYSRMAILGWCNLMGVLATFKPWKNNGSNSRKNRGEK